MNDFNRQIDVIGVPLDLGAGLRGVDGGPSAVRHAGLVKRLRALGYLASDSGNIVTPVADSVDEGSTRARYAEPVGAVCSELRTRVRQAIQNDRIPLVLGGDHSIAAGSMAGFRDERPDLRVLWIDAHGDLNTPETSPSGNCHGMPLGVALGQAIDLFSDLSWRERPLAPESLALVGLRSLDAGERELIHRLGILAFTMSDIDRVGLYDVVSRALQHLAPDRGRLHVSLDVDVIDPTAAPGVGTPVPGGLTVREAHLAMELIAQTNTLGSLEVVEINAIRDRENQTGQLAADLILSAFGQTIL